jgi:peptidoglycan/LPS O-acetylase OafA/YrhL
MTARRGPRDRFRGDIEGLRAVAVLLVVAFHAGVSVISGGFVGVDVFFVLSGFLITGLLVDEVRRSGTISLADFYARRIRRLLPLSTLVLVATAVATFLLIPPIDRKGIAGDLVGAALWGANWRFAAESTQYMADTDKSPVLHFWSLSVEEQFYVVWPLLLLLLVGRTGLAKRAWSVVFRRMTLGLGVLVAVSLFLSWQLAADASPFAYFGLHTRAWELGIGAALALARPVLPLLSRPAAHVAAAAGALMVVASALVMDETTPFPGTAALVPVLGTALLVAAGARIPDEGVARALSHPVPRYIGRISYAWYLWHWPVLVLAKAHFGQASEGAADGAAATEAPWTVIVAAVALSFALSVASHHLFEQPMRQARFLTGSRVRSLQAGGALVAVSLLFSGGLVASGLASGEQRAVDAPAAASAAESKLLGTEVADLGPRTPDEARADEPRGGPCYAGFSSTSAPPPEQCRVGPASGAKRTIVLLGDSHAHAWRPAFERAAKENGWTVYFWAKSACNISDVAVYSRTQKARYANCIEWREKVLDQVASIKEVDAVVIGRYPVYANSVLLPDGSQTTADTVGPVWTAASRRTFDRLGKVTDRIVMLHDVPWPTGNVPSCLSENPDDVEACAFDREKRSGLDAPLLKAEKAADPKAVRLVDLTNVICPEQRCQVVTSAGQIKYRDNTHLSAGYSTALWRPLSERLEAAIG